MARYWRYLRGILFRFPHIQRSLHVQPALHAGAGGAGNALRHVCTTGYLFVYKSRPMIWGTQRFIQIHRKVAEGRSSSWGQVLSFALLSLNASLFCCIGM